MIRVCGIGTSSAYSVVGEHLLVESQSYVQKYGARTIPLNMCTSKYPLQKHKNNNASILTIFTYILTGPVMILIYMQHVNYSV